MTNDFFLWKSSVNWSLPCIQSPYPPSFVFWSIHKTVISNQRPDLNFQKFMFSISLLIRRNKIAQLNKIKNDFSWSTKRTTAHWWRICMTLYYLVLFELMTTFPHRKEWKGAIITHHQSYLLYITAQRWHPGCSWFLPKLVHKTILLSNLKEKPVGCR